MNTLKFYPEKIRKTYEMNIRNSGIKTPPEDYHNLILEIVIVISFTSSILFYLLKINMLYSLLVFVVMNLFFYFRISLKASSRIKQMEQVFPDFISLMASNLRSGITVDRAFVLSARPEFSPLDGEILKAGREIATGKDIIHALMDMAEKIDSEKITKTVMLITSGLKAGGNIADLLEQTSANMKEKEYIEKRAAANTLMYVIFIFIAVSVGAPVLFALSSILVEIIINLVANIPAVSTRVDLPFTFTSVAVSARFIIYFSVIFITITDLISCFVIGLVRKGDAKTGLRFFIPLVALSLGIFFIARILLSKFLADAFALI